MNFLRSLFGKKEAPAPSPRIPVEKLMTSQLPALFLRENDPFYHEQYIRMLMEIGFLNTNAEKMFQFECNVIRRHPKEYLLRLDFTTRWFFGLSQPFFLQYPKSKEDILKEKFLTMSELCKIIDEAEWHFWNSHERALSDDVWAEIYAWHLKGPGGEFAVSYFEMIEQETGIPSENISSLCSLQGEHLSRYKWRASTYR